MLLTCSLDRLWKEQFLSTHQMSSNPGFLNPAIPRKMMRKLLLSRSRSRAANLKLLQEKNMGKEKGKSVSSPRCFESSHCLRGVYAAPIQHHARIWAGVQRKRLILQCNKRILHPYNNCMTKSWPGPSYQDWAKGTSTTPIRLRPLKI